MPVARTCLVIAILILAPAATAAEVPASSVDELAVTRSGDTLTVNGTATISDASDAVVGTDPAGDPQYRDVPVEDVGADVVSARIHHRPALHELWFTLDIADPMPTTFTIPEVIHYHWLIEVTNGEDSAVFLLQAMRSGQYDRPIPSADPLFRVNACSLNSAGTPSCFNTLRHVDGVMANGIVQWQVPVEDIQAFSGATIAPYRDGAVVKYGASGATYGSPGFDEIETLPFVVGPAVALGIQSADLEGGTPILHTTPTALGPDGTFTGKLATPGLPGDYVLSARVCHGDARGCGTREVTITVE